jgi:signal transduction histidine kinase
VVNGPRSTARPCSSPCIPWRRCGRAGRAGLRGLLEVVAVTALLLYAGSRWWFDAIFLSGMVAAALGLGLYFAARRAYLAELHDRAERLERERDQQAALAAAAERARIAREMHDIVAHHLTVMTTLAEAAVAASASSPEKATDVMRSVAVTGRRALADTRRLLGVLREPPWRPGRHRGPAAGTRSHPAGRPDRTGPFGWT